MNLIKWLFGEKGCGIPAFENPPPPPALLVSDRQRLIIGREDYRKLADWWGVLNCWGWPPELGTPEPRPKNKDWKLGRRSALMKLIENKVGYKFLLRYHNSDMTENEFEDFWQATRGKDKGAWTRYYARIQQRAARSYKH